MNKKEINREVIEERIEKYINSHWDDIILDIDRRVETAVKKEIREIFSSNYRDEKSEALKLIEGRVSELTEVLIKNMEINKQDIEKQIKDKITSKVKSLKINIS